MFSVKNPQGTPLRLITSTIAIKKQWLTLDHWYNNFSMSCRSMFNWATFRQILLPSWKKYLSQRSSLKHTCSWHDKLIVLWILNRQAVISLRILDHWASPLNNILKDSGGFKKKKKQVKKKKWNYNKNMAPFYGYGSAASGLEPIRGGSLLYNTKFPEIPGTHFINLRRMKGWVDLWGIQ